MLNKVRDRRPSYNNDAAISSSATVSNLKLAYYHCIAFAFRLAGQCVDLCFVNSSWTEAHMKHMWRPFFRGTLGTVKLYPPCNTACLQLQSGYSLNGGVATTKRERIILSVAQFRPEKDHLLQLKSV